MEGSIENAPGRAIVADIGGTNARFAVADLTTLQLSDFQSFSCADHPTIAHAAQAYVQRLDRVPTKAALAVAAPVTGEGVEFTNSPWSFHRRDFAAALGLDSLLILNDFQALAMSLPYIADEELTQLGGTKPVEKATKLVVGPGTGLGAAGLVWSEAGWIAVPGEGGHINLAPAHLHHLPLLKRLMDDREHLSAERVISGPGLCDLYQAVAEERCVEVPEREAAEIVARATSGEDDIAKETLEHFVCWLGSYAGDAALMMGARGGVYIGGGIAVRILDILREGDFRRYFEAKGRMRDAFLASIPIYVITAQAPALQGAAAALREAINRDDQALIGVA